MDILDAIGNTPMARLEIEGGGRVFLEEKTLWPDGKYVTTHLIVNKREYQPV